MRPPQSAIRDAIRDELGRLEITRYELWKRARVHCPTLPESAVYEHVSQHLVGAGTAGKGVVGDPAGPRGGAERGP